MQSVRRGPDRSVQGTPELVVMSMDAQAVRRRLGHLDALGGAWTLALDTFTLIASQYALEEDALDDYDAVRAAYEDLGVIDTYDAAIVTKDPKGKVKIVKKVEEPNRQGAIGGLAVG